MSITREGIMNTAIRQAQQDLYNTLMNKYLFGKDVNISDYIEVFKTEDVAYYTPNDEDLGSIVAIHTNHKLAVFTGFYDTADFEDVDYGGVAVESDYAKVLNKDFELVCRFELS